VCEENSGTLRIIIYALGALVTVLLAYLVYSEWLRSLRRKQRSIDDRRRVQECIDSLQTLNFYAAFVKGVDFIRLGKLRSHEELRDRGLLVYKDVPSRRERRIFFVVFFSHQWCSTHVPDPEGRHFEVMRSALIGLASLQATGDTMSERANGARQQRATTRAKQIGTESKSRMSVRHSSTQEDIGLQQLAKWRSAVISRMLERMPRRARAFIKSTFEYVILQRTLVWVDYACVPQKNYNMKMQAISSISTYAAAADAFVVIAPPAYNNSEGSRDVNFTSYQTRFWTRAEQFCHGTVNGIGAMWLATGKNDLQKLASHKLLSAGDRWLIEMLHVFDGECFDERDKLALVLPLVGLYSEMYASRDDFANAGMPFLQRVWSVLQQHKSTVFPSVRTLKVRKVSLIKEYGAQANGSMPSSFNGGESSAGEPPIPELQSERFELFGRLIRTAERMIDADSELREKLRAQSLRRRQNAMNGWTDEFVGHMLLRGRTTPDCGMAKAPHHMNKKKDKRWSASGRLSMRSGRASGRVDAEASLRRVGAPEASPPPERSHFVHFFERPRASRASQSHMEDKNREMDDVESVSC